jgi:hypothetical protein
VDYPPAQLLPQLTGRLDRESHQKLFQSARLLLADHLFFIPFRDAQEFLLLYQNSRLVF